MKIDPYVLDAIKGMDLPGLMRSYGLELKSAGRNAFHLQCPFHEDKTPSLSVGYRNNKWMWNCFGCHVHGNFLDFRIAYEKIPFSDAYVKSAEELRLSPSKVNGNGFHVPPAKSPAPLPTVNRSELLSRAVRVYEESFQEDRRGQEYLAGRGIKDVELLRRHRVGYVTGRLRRMLPEDPEHETVRGLKEVGILNEKGREHFHGCVVFPIFDGNGGVVGLYGRRVSALAFGPDHLYLPGPRVGVWNGEAVKAYREIVLTESIVDALSLEVLGIPNAVALYGVNGLTEGGHSALFQEHRTKRVFLCLDNDKAGDEARGRVKEKIEALGVKVVDIYLPRQYKDANAALKGGVTGEEVKGLLSSVSGARPDGEPAAVVESSSAASPAASDVPVVEEREDGLHAVFGRRRYRVRGLAAEDLEHLRVNVKVESEEGSHLDTLDLYSSKARATFVAVCGKIFRVGAGELERELNQLIEALESVQSKSLAVREKRDECPSPMTEEEKGEAMGVLKSPDLLGRVLGDMGALGYVGEEANKAVGYLVGVSRKLEEPMSCVLMSQSSAGKSVLAETVERMTPPEDVLIFSRLTTNGLFYMKRDALKHKLLIMEERVGAEAADYSIRTLQSKRKLVQAVPVKDEKTGKIETQIFEVEGPIAYVETTTRPRVADDNATRCFELSLDESREQTRRVHEAQRRAKTLGGLKEKQEGEAICRRHWTMQRLLRPVRVVIPYADKLDFPTSWIRTRRDHMRFLNLIEVICFLHQHQRAVEQTADGAAYITATVEDYAAAYELAGKVMGESLTELKKPQRELLKAMGGMKGGSEGLTRREIREHVGISDTRLRELLGELVSLEYVRQTEGGGRGLMCRYHVMEGAAGEDRLTGLTRPDELRRRLESAPV